MSRHIYKKKNKLEFGMGWQKKGKLSGNFQVSKFIYNNFNKL